METGKRLHVNFRIYLGFLALLALYMPTKAQITRVHVIFKTHLDIGFTDLSSAVERNYIQNFIPRAIDVAEQLRKEKSEDRYVWTTGAWLVQSYLEQASPVQREKFEQAVRQGDIVWNAMPYTVESESMNRTQFETLLNLSKKLDRRFGKQTIGAKMTDVPGHTQAIVPLLAAAGIRFLHIGVNPASQVPHIPNLCRWRGTDGSEIILMYQDDYGSETILPDGRTAVAFAFTGDNHGPHSAKQVKDIFVSLRRKYPHAEVMASTLDSVAKDLEPMRNRLPLVREEIGDTWIYGFGSSPLRMAAFRALGRLYSRWVSEGRLNPESDEAIAFAVRSGLIAEHTWGIDVKTHLRNWDKYDVDKFKEARNMPEFKKAEASWQELTDNMRQAIACLPASLKDEAYRTLDSTLNPPHPQELQKAKKGKSLPSKRFSPEGALQLNEGGARMKAGVLAYQSFSMKEYERFFKNYMTHPYGWAFQDFGKPGLDKSQAKSVSREFHVTSFENGREQGELNLDMRTDDDSIDRRVMPTCVRNAYRILPKEKAVEWSVTLTDMPGNRLPEAYWFSFYPEDVTSIEVEKTGQLIDVTNVAEGGNRQMHGIDRHVLIHTSRGDWRISSLDALLVAVGQRDLLNYSDRQPDLSGGVHFCLYNNAWGTNFSQWFEGTARFRFRAEWIPLKTENSGKTTETR